MSDEEHHTDPAPNDETTDAAAPSPEADPPKPAGVLRGDSGLDTAQIIIAAFLIVIGGLLACASACMVPLHGEDRALFAETEALHNVTTFPNALDAMPDAPLSLLSLAFGWKFFGGPGGAHAVSLLFHLANGVLLYLLCRKLLPAPVRNPMAMAAGMLFVLHPLTAESLCLLAARPSVQGAFFGLLGLVLLVNALGEEAHPRRRTLAMVSYVLAVGSAPLMLGLPLIYAALEWWRGGAAALRRNQGYHLIGLGVLVALVVARAATGAGDWGQFPKGVGETLAAQSAYAAAPLLKIFLPMQHLSAAHPGAEGVALSVTGLAILLVLALGCGAALMLRKPAGVALAWIFVTATALPCLVPMDALLAERNFYFLLGGVVLLVVLLLDSLRTAPAMHVAGGLLAVMVIACGAGMFLRAEAWRYPDTLWAEAAARTGVREARLQRAQYLSDFSAQAPAPETLGAARDAWREALEGAEGTARTKALFGLGVAEQRLQEFDAALEHLTEALRRDPSLDEASVKLGVIHAERGRTTGNPDEMRTAMEYFGRAQRRGALRPEAYGAYAMALSSVGNVEGAAVMMQAAAADTPADSPQMQAVAELRAMVQALEAREVETARRFQENPNSTVARLLLGDTLLQRRRLLRALYIFERAVESQPQSLESWSALGLVRGMLGSGDGFVVALAESGLDASAAWPALAQRCGRAGQWEVARAYMGAAREMGAISELPEIALADAALAVEQNAMADRFLTEAAEAHPDSPEPWLKRCDLALAAGDQAEAARTLQEAARRGASEAQLEARKAAGEVDPTRTGLPQPTIIR